MSIVELRGVSVTFGGARAVADVDLTIEPGTALAIVGPNGAGKSTLLNATNRLVPISAGTISLFGADVTTMRPDRIARLGLGRSFQNPRLIESASALENVMVGTEVRAGYSWLDQVVRLRKVRRRETALAASCRALIEEAGLAGVADAPVSTLSYGAHKLIDILRALAAEPELVLLDEPTSGLGLDDRRALVEVLKHYRARTNVTMLLVEHHGDVVRELADRVVALEAGVVIEDRDTESALVSQGFLAEDDLADVHRSAAEVTETPGETA